MKRVIFLVLVSSVILGICLAQVPEEYFYGSVSAVAIVLLALPACFGLLKTLGYKKGATLILALGLFSLAIETIGLKTGFPYGGFEYGHDLGPILFGATPSTVFFAWFPLVLSTYTLARFHSTRAAKVPVLIMAVLLLVSLDLVLDPAAVARGLWSYSSAGYFGVPLSNFMGWVFSGAIALTLIQVFLGSKIITRRNYFYLLFAGAFTLGLWTGVALGYGLYYIATSGMFFLWFLFKEVSCQLQSKALSLEVH